MATKPREAFAVGVPCRKVSGSNEPSQGQKASARDCCRQARFGRVAWSLAILVAGMTAPIHAEQPRPAEQPTPAEQQRPSQRPAMRQMPVSSALQMPPSQRDLVAARKELKARFREPLLHTETTAGAMAAAEELFAAAISEEEPRLKWLLLAESRRLATTAGNAAAITRAITLACATYEFDALELELRSLTEIPLRSLDSARAVAFATVAENLALRAEADGRLEIAVSGQTLAIRAWQRAGNTTAARRAAIRHDALENARQQRLSEQKLQPKNPG